MALLLHLSAPADDCMPGAAGLPGLLRPLIAAATPFCEAAAAAPCREHLTLLVLHVCTVVYVNSWRPCDLDASHRKPQARPPPAPFCKGAVLLQPAVDTL